MGIINYQETFADALSVTTSAMMSNVLKLDKNIGKGEPISIHGFVDGEAFVGSACALRISLKSAATEALCVAGATSAWTTDWFVVASMTAGFQFDLPDIPDKTDIWVGLHVDTSGTFTAGQVGAEITLGKQTNEYMAGRTDVIPA
jgi:hypothetical protein